MEAQSHGVKPKSKRLTITFVLVAPFVFALFTPMIPGWNTPARPQRAVFDGPPPKRIITIAPNAAEIICALGDCDLLVGVSKFAVYPPELADLPRVGGLIDPNLERITALRPDLIVLRGANESIERLCEDRGITLYQDRTNRVDDIAFTVRDLAKCLGRVDRGHELVAGLRAGLQAIHRRVSGKTRPRVFISAARELDGLSNILTTGRGTFVDEMIQTAGGENVFAHLDARYPQVSPEAIVAQRPEVIIEFMPEVELTDARRKQLMAQWGELDFLPAVRNGRIHFITDDHALIPSIRLVGIVEKLSLLLHPELTVDGQ